MKIDMTHNENIVTFDDIACNLELDDERLEATRSSTHAYVAESSSRKASNFKRKRNSQFNNKGKNID